MRKIPHTMATQHPDNATNPPWARGDLIEGNDEVHEAYLAYREFGIEEVMWDAEGKDVDTHVVRKLLSNYSDYFKEKVLGEDIFLTYRIPNPSVELAERKIVSEILESIATSYDIVRDFYKRSRPPIFEVILPLTSSHIELLCVKNYYEKVVSGKDSVELFKGIDVARWLGETRPRSIEVIPLIEDRYSIYHIAGIVGKYIKATKAKVARVFIARSDPALNYGLIPAVLLAKYAISELSLLESKLGTRVYPIIGAGPPPFRGNLNPQNVEGVIEEYKGTYTYTIQSSFRYDNPSQKVIDAISKINSIDNDAVNILHKSEKRILAKIIDGFVALYQPAVEDLAMIINEIGRIVPKRRARKLHVGLYGYSRGVGRVVLPRAIPFTAALYSIGIPPEIIGIRALGSLKEEEWNFLLRTYKNLRKDLAEAANYFCWDSFEYLAKTAPKGFRINDRLMDAINQDVNFLSSNMGIKVGEGSYLHRKHSLLSCLFTHALCNAQDSEAQGYLVEMAKTRGFLG